MDFFDYRNGRLYAEQIDVAEIAREYGSPCYIYSRKTLERHWRAFDNALGVHPHLVCYAVKANSNLAILNLLARLGSGFDIVSVGELERVLKAGGDASRVVFSGVGKREEEMRRAMEVGIHCFNVESESELLRLDRVSGRQGLIAPVSLRVNPNVDAKTHPYIATGLKESKFGIAFGRVLDVYQRAAELANIRVMGIGCHIGSQLTQLDPFVESVEIILQLAETLEARGIPIEHLDLGGGLGIQYQHEAPPLPGEYAYAIFEVLKDKPYTLLLEPGRAIMGNAGILITTIEYLKYSDHKNFAVVDAAMNDLMRPALYDAWQDISSVVLNENVKTECYDVVGPVCESGDFLGKDRCLAVKQGDLLVVRSAGAYGFSMSSQYNSRPRPAEVIVDGEQTYLVRARESIDQLMQGEQILPE